MTLETSLPPYPPRGLRARPGIMRGVEQSRYQLPEAAESAERGAPDAPRARYSRQVSVKLFFTHTCPATANAPELRFTVS